MEERSMTLMSLTDLMLMQILCRFEYGFFDRRDAVREHRRGRGLAVEDRSPRQAPDAIVLHAMGFNRESHLSYDGVNAHFAVLRDGKVLYLHDISEYLNASHDFNRRGVAIEFAGNPPNANGGYYRPDRFGRHIPTREQIRAGRALVRALVDSRGITHIFGHRQSCGTKICPGPHLWYNIGRWAVQELGLSDGGAGYSTSNAYCTGRAIPESWLDPRWEIDLGQSSSFGAPDWMRRGMYCTPP
jgi:hypothetical protein